MTTTTMQPTTTPHNASSPLLSDSQNEARTWAQKYLNTRLNAQQADASSPSSVADNKAFTVPVIDISKTFTGGDSGLEEKKIVAAKIREACTGSGFFQITGHGVSETVRNGVLNQANRFFKQLSPAKKEELHVKNSRYMRGWEPADYTYVNPDDWETEVVPETKEGFNWGYEPGLDPTGGDGLYTELDGGIKNGNVWPSSELLPGFYDGIKDYYSQVLSLGRHLCKLFALSLGLEESFFDTMMTHPGGIARLLYYPPSADPRPLDALGKDKEIGLGAHSDYECFTILLSSTKQGLEILSPEGVWVASPAVEGGFIINVADFFMRWTNDMYKSTVHRVVNRTDKERFSVPFFFSVNYDTLVETLPSCISDDNPAKYKPIKAGQYVLERLNATTKDGENKA